MLQQLQHPAQRRLVQGQAPPAIHHVQAVALVGVHEVKIIQKRLILPVKTPFRQVDHVPRVQGDAAALAPFVQESPQLPHGVPALVQDVQRQLHPVRPQHQDRLQGQGQPLGKQLISQ